MADGLKAACRRLLAGGGWVTTAEAEAALAGEVPDDLAAKTWDRLARAGWTDPGTAAARLAAGRARVVRERMQRLASDGLAEAEGDGADRRYRLIAGVVMGSEKPKPKREWLPVERLTFDARLQMRDLPDGKVYDEQTAARYAGLLEGDEPADFPDLDVVHDGKRYWVIAGFNRGEAFRRAGKGSVPCMVYEGTFDDARLWCLSENSRHGKGRTDADCRRAFDQLVGDPKIVKRVLAGAKADGGVHRAICKATGLSHGAVDKYLKAAGLKATRDGKIVPAETPKPSPARASSPPPPPPPAPEPPPVGAKDWRDLPVAEGLDGQPNIFDALAKEGIETLGDLAAALKAGRTFFLAEGELADLRDAIAQASADDAEPVSFTAEPGPMFTVPPPPPAPHGLDRFKDAAKGGKAPGHLAAYDQAAGQLVRDLKAVAAGLEQILPGPAGTYLRKVVSSAGGEPRALFELRAVAGRGGVAGHRWACPLLEFIVRAVQRTRIDKPCACGGTGCEACDQSGFLPARRELPKDGQLVFDLGNPWDEPEGGE